MLNAQALQFLRIMQEINQRLVELLQNLPDDIEAPKLEAQLRAILGALAN